MLIALLGPATAIARAAIPVTLQLVSAEDKPLVTAWPVVPPLPAPQGLRPCCAFGYDLHAQVLHMPVPFYELDNVVTIDSIGEHRYNDSLLLGLANLAGIGHENNGIVYTARGGFIDTAHVRDTADMTAWLFSHLLPRLGQSFTLRLDDELAQRHVVFNAFTPPQSLLIVTRWRHGWPRIWRFSSLPGMKLRNGMVLSLFQDFRRRFLHFPRKISTQICWVPELRYR